MPCRRDDHYEAIWKHQIKPNAHKVRFTKTYTWKRSPRAGFGKGFYTGPNKTPCVIDVFMSAVHFMEGGEPLPWWSFTQERKNHMAQQKR
jgi:hypothetical protein